MGIISAVRSATMPVVGNLINILDCSVPVLSAPVKSTIVGVVVDEVTSGVVLLPLVPAMS